MVKNKENPQFSGTFGNIVEIVWTDNQVEIQMKEFDTTQRYTYILEYND